MSEKDLKVFVTGDASGLFKALGDASLAMKNMATEMEASVGGLKTLFSNFAAPLLAITAVFAGNEFLKGITNDTKDWNGRRHRNLRGP